MNRIAHAKKNFTLRKLRVRTKVNGTTERPRLSVFISNRNITAQIIDDSKSATLTFVTTVGQPKLPKTMTEKAEWVGTEIATQAKAKKIKKVVFDRSGRLYHGRVQSLANAARKAGLEF